MNSKYGFSYIKDTTFDSKRIDDPYILEAYIPDKYYVHADNLLLSKINELIHPVGLVASRSLKYFSTNGEAFNIFRARGMAVWWPRHIYFVCNNNHFIFHFFLIHYLIFNKPFGTCEGVLVFEIY